MELLMALIIGCLTATGVFLLLRARLFPVIVGLTLVGYAVNLFLLVSGRLVAGQPPIVDQSGSPADPLPQALVLTAIVINFAMTAFLVVLALRRQGELHSDRVDGDDQDD